MITIIEQSVEKSISYQEYSELLQKLITEEKSTSLEQTLDRIAYTKLNASRMRRLDKNLDLSPLDLAGFRDLETPQTWLVITESWCGDAAQTLPIVNKIAQVNPNITLRIVFRDEHPALMNLFLTNGTRSIPKLLILNQENRLIHSWGPRSKAATDLVQAYKIQYGKIDDNFKAFLQKWYNQDKGAAIIKDLSFLIHSKNMLEELDFF